MTIPILDESWSAGALPPKSLAGFRREEVRSVEVPFVSEFDCSQGTLLAEDGAEG